MTHVPMRLPRRSIVIPLHRMSVHALPIRRIPFERIPVQRIAARVAFILAKAFLKTGLVGLLTATLASNRFG